MSDVVQLRDFARTPSASLDQPRCQVVPFKMRDRDIDELCREAEQLCVEALRQSLIIYCEMVQFRLLCVEASIARMMACVVEPDSAA